MSNSEPHSEIYHVFPTDPKNEVAISKTRDFLNAIASGDITNGRGSEGQDYWEVPLGNEYLDCVKAYPAIRIVELRQSPQERDTDENIASPRGKTFRDPRKQMHLNLVLEDPFNKEKVEETRQWLIKMTGDENSFSEWHTDPVQGKNWKETRGVEGFGGLPVDKAILKEYMNHGVKTVFESHALQYHRAITIENALEIALRPKVMRKRAPTADENWTKQEDVHGDLLSVSQYQGLAIGDLDIPEYVYPKDAGKGIEIYVIDTGIQVKAKYKNHENEMQPEFPHFSRNIATVAAERQKGTRPLDEDHAEALVKSFKHGHGTPVASKALGSNFGVAKSASLINVQIADLAYHELIEAMKLIRADLNEHHEGNKKTNAVVLTALGEGFDPKKPLEKILNLPQATSYTVSIGAIMKEHGVPVVFSAGNNNREVYSLPQLLDGPEFPIITVGAANTVGNRLDLKESSSNYGPRVHIWANGENCQLQSKIDGEVWEESGTSFAAPIVAGVIATHMGSSPWNEGGEESEGLNRVERIKQYIASEKSSWVRQESKDNLRMVWNGADEQAHRSVKANLFREE